MLYTFQVSAQPIKWIPFMWQSETIDGRTFDKFSIVIPVKIEKINEEFKMQFDLGAEQTFIYGNTIAPYLTQNQSLKNKLDTSLSFFMSGKRNPMFAQLSLQLGEITIPHINVGLYKNYGREYGSAPETSGSEKLIGTIGADLFAGKVLVIDYDLQRISISESIPALFRNVSLQLVTIDGGRVKIPVRIGDNTRSLLFDTGSSLFTLLTSESNALQVSDKPVIDSFKTYSWGNQYFVFQKKMNQSIFIGKKSLGDPSIFFDKIGKFDHFYEDQHIWGIIGNSCFQHNILIIDFKNSTIGIK